MAINKSIIGVTDTGATITIDDGNSVESPAKTAVKVSYTGDDVSLTFPATDQTGLTTWTANFANYTAPTGVSAAAVASAIEAFMDTASSTVTVSEVTPGTDADNLGKVVGAVAGATDVGVATLAIRDDVLTTLGDADGDYVQLRTTSTGAQWTRDTVLNAVLQGTGTELRVDVLSVVPGTGASSLGKAVDSAAGATDTGVMGLSVVDAVLSAITPVDGDYAPTRVNASGALWTTISAGEDHMGSTGGNSAKLASIITTTNGTAYTSGDNIGGVNTISNASRVNGGTEILMDIDIWDTDNQSAPLTIDYWSVTPPNGTYTNDAAQVIAGDEAVWLGRVNIVAGDYETTGAVATVSLKNQGLVVNSASASTDIFFTIKVTAAPTYTSTSGFTVYHGFLQD